MRANLTCVRVIEQLDGEARLSIFKRSDGLHCFKIEVEQHDDISDWILSETSGIYQTAEEAEVAGRNHEDWPTDPNPE